VPAYPGFADNPGGMSASSSGAFGAQDGAFGAQGGFNDPFQSQFPPAPGSSFEGANFGAAADYSFSSAMPAGDAMGASGMSNSGFGGAPAFPDYASASGFDAAGGSHHADMHGSFGGGDASFGAQGGFPPAGTNASNSASHLLAQSGRADLETAKDQLVGQAAAAAQATMGSGAKTAAVTDAVFKITVTDPVKQGDGMRSYISYKINTKTTLPQYQWKEFSVIHRYRDFVWLWEQLKIKYEHVIIPPLPEKAVTGNFEPTFIQLRRAALEKFLQRVAGHPVLRDSEDLQIFLEANDETLQSAKSARSSAAASQQGSTPAGKKKQAGFFQSMKEFAQGISNTVGKLPEEFADPAYEEQKVKIEELKNQVNALQQYTKRLVHRMRELSVTMTETGTACNLYAQVEQDKLENSFRRVGDANDKIGMMTGEHASVVEQELDAVLCENVLMLNAVQDLFTNRQTAIVSLQTARSAHMAKVKQYETVKGDPRKTGRAHELSREIAEAEEEEKQMKQRYDAVKASMTEELDRFQKERVGNFRDMLMGYARCNAEYHQAISSRWAELLKDLEAEFSSM